MPVLSLSVNIRDSTVGMGSAEGTEEGAEDLEQAGNTVIEPAEDIGAVGAQDTTPTGKEDPMSLFKT